MTQLQLRIQAVRSRQQRQWCWNCVSWGLLLGGAVASVLGFTRLLTQGAFDWFWVIVPLGTGATLGWLYALFTRRTEKHAAVTIDRVCHLKDRAETALQFQRTGKTNSLRRLQIEDAEQYLSTIVPEHVVPIRAPRFWSLAMGLTIVALVLAIVSGPQPTLQANEQSNAVVETQAGRIERQLEELTQFQEQQNNPELEQLLKDLQGLLEQMKQPGLDPKEALATISEMEASLQQLQQQLHDPQSASDLSRIGEALSLSDAMASAGAALSKGDLEKGADLLEKLEKPDLDRQTEKAITEKLDQVHQGNQGGSQKSNLQEAAGQISQGISQGNRGKFQDGMKNLAGEARKQGQKKKLLDLLKKQCQCLGECKSECESECRNQAESQKKGGRKAGTAASGNQPGDKTSKLKTAPALNIKGQESSSGDSEIETVSGDEQQQEAIRNYREQVQDFEALSESALESESIPLGHRQTVRRYFQLIRPTAGEVDQVNQATREDSSPRKP